MFHAESFVGGDTDMVNISSVPDGFKKRIGKAKHQYILYGFFGQIMIDPKYLVFFEIFMKTAQFTKSLTVSMRPEVFDQIKQITDEKKISIGEWIREAIDNALADNNREEEPMK